MSPDQRARALRLADVLDSFYQREVLETASFLRELAAEPERVPLPDWIKIENDHVIIVDGVRVDRDVFTFFGRTAKLGDYAQFMWRADDGTVTLRRVEKGELK